MTDEYVKWKHWKYVRMTSSRASRKTINSQKRVTKQVQFTLQYIITPPHLLTPPLLFWSFCDTISLNIHFTNSQNSFSKFWRHYQYYKWDWNWKEHLNDPTIGHVLKRRIWVLIFKPGRHSHIPVNFHLLLIQTIEMGQDIWRTVDLFFTHAIYFIQLCLSNGTYVRILNTNKLAPLNAFFTASGRNQ